MDKSLITLGASVKDVLIAINEVPAGVAFVIDHSQKLLGLITDGDIRRQLISGISLDAKLEKSMVNDQFVYAYQGDKIPEMISKTNVKIRIIPIVDKDFKIVDYFQYDHRTHFTPVAEPNLQGKELEYLMDAFLSTWISSKGKYIDKFEDEFSKYCRTKFGVATSNGTTALHLALEALGVGEGDEVIIPNLTFAATINVVLHSGATPVLVDIEEEFWTIDPAKIEKAITPKTKAIIPVHLYGIPCDMTAIMTLAKKHNLYVIEDCAEAHGAEFENKKIGSFGDVSCFSFFANKIITTGEGGMCLTNDPEIDRKMRILRDHGMSKERRFYHELPGFNYRMTNLQAAIGCAQLERINSILEERRLLEQKYKRILGTENFTWPSDSDSRRNRVVWLISCLTDRRDEIVSTLKDKMIETRPFFVPLSDMDIYKKFRYEGEISHLIASKGMNFPTIEKVDIEEIHQLIN